MSVAQPDGRVAGKVVLVTGSASGMGHVHVARLLEEGATVVATDLASDLPSALVQHQSSGRFTYCRHDVTAPDDWRGVVEETLERYGRIDGLVNNAGIVIKAPLDELSLDDYRRVIDVNQVGVFLGMKAVAPAMKTAGQGSIINISSTAGLVGRPDTIAYTASKFAVRGMTKVGAVDLGPHGVRVNSIHPGTIRTPMYDSMADDWKERMLEEIPSGRVGEAVEVANLVVFLASDEAKYCNGSEFVIDGGLTCR